jgi:opacity protein-like surface antigen
VNTLRVTPFFVAGGGMFWSRESFLSGPFWSSDPSFTVGGGLRGSVTDRISIAAEYRLGWELHHRLTGSLTFNLR